MVLENIKNCLHGVMEKFFCFTKASFSLIGLTFGRALAEYSFVGFLFVLINQKTDEHNLRHDAVVSNVKDAFASLLTSFLVYTTQRRQIRPFKMILFTHAIFLSGILILIFVPSPTIEILYLALLLLSLDKSGDAYMQEFLTVDPSLDKFFANLFMTFILAEQVIADQEPRIKRLDAWWSIARLSGALIGIFLISLLELLVIFKISATVIGVGCIFFAFVRKTPNAALLDGRHDQAGQENNHQLWSLGKFFLQWTPFLSYYAVEAAGSTFFIVQMETLDFPVHFLYAIQKLGGLICSSFIIYGVTKFWSKQSSNQKERRATLTEITLGLIVCFFCCIVAWHAEKERLREGNYPLMMSLFILQFVLLGTMKGLVEELMEDFFYDQVIDESMHHLETVFNSFVKGIGKFLGVVCILVFPSWIQDTVDASRLDKYYRTLASMTLCALLMFGCLSNTCYWKENANEDSNRALEEGILDSNRQFSSSLLPSGAAEIIQETSEQTPLPAETGFSSTLPSSDAAEIIQATSEHAPLLRLFRRQKTLSGAADATRSDPVVKRQFTFPGFYR